MRIFDSFLIENFPLEYELWITAIRAQISGGNPLEVFLRKEEVIIRGADLSLLQAFFPELEVEPLPPFDLPKWKVKLIPRRPRCRGEVFLRYLGEEGILRISFSGKYAEAYSSEKRKIRNLRRILSSLGYSPIKLGEVRIEDLCLLMPLKLQKRSSLEGSVRLPLGSFHSLLHPLRDLLSGEL